MSQTPIDDREKGNQNSEQTRTLASTDDVSKLEKGEPAHKYELIAWDTDDSAHPTNFPLRTKWAITLTVSLGAICTTTCSSMVSLTYAQVEREFHISAEVATLGITLFITGLGLGPLYLGPLSEFFGRNPIYRISFLFFLIFNIPVAVAKNAETWLVGRFLSGVSGSAFLSVAGGSVSDLFVPKDVGAPMAIYSASPFLGPVLGPIIAGFINQHTTWRWTWYVQIIWAGVQLGLLLLIPETYEPKLLRQKAQAKCKELQRDDIKAPMDIKKRNIGRVLFLSCVIPFKLVASEPMALMLDIWTSLILGILYMFFSAFPLTFSAHGFNLQEQGLSFLGIGIGIVIATSLNPLFGRRYARIAEQKGDVPVPPEEHLYKAMWAALIAPASLFWFAFTTDPSIHWIVPMIASIPFGVSMIWAFSATFTFLVDAYRPYAASALAGNSFFRSAFAAAFPLFTRQMYGKLGTDWASALCAFLMLGMAPFPFLFYKYGARLQSDSKYTTPRN